MARSSADAGVSGRPHRVLYDAHERERPDNQTDAETFLKRLTLNARVRERAYVSSAIAAWTISQQCAMVVVHAGLHAALVDGSAEARGRIRLELGALAGGGVAWALGGSSGGRGLGGLVKRSLRSLRLFALVSCGLAALTPLCQTMTAAVSDDTAAVCSALSLGLYVLAYDYAFANLETKQLASSFSLGAAMFATMLMASRLDDRPSVFADALLALECYVLAPYVWRAVRVRSTALHLIVVFTVHVWAFIIARECDPLLGWAFVAWTFLLAVLSPGLLVFLARRGKTQIAGPWDEALPKLYLFRGTERASGVPRYRHYYANKRSIE
jgi:phosphatidylinositol N-acetylglucosaminyltransferase subunit C